MLLFLGLGNINAQEKQNDATWEETIAFINKYEDQIANKSSAKKNYFSVTPGYFVGHKEGRMYNEVWKYYKDVFKRESVKTEDLIYIKDIRGVPSRFDIWFTRDVVRVKHNWFFGKKPPRDYYTDSLGDLTVLDDELKPRIYKAFKHLAYLATQKRESKRKASGDKF